MKIIPVLSIALLLSVVQLQAVNKEHSTLSANNKSVCKGICENCGKEVRSEYGDVEEEQITEQERDSEESDKCGCGGGGTKPKTKVTRVEDDEEEEEQMMEEEENKE